MKPFKFLTLAVFAGFFPSALSAQQAITIAPRHRYQFNNSAGNLTAGAQVNDSIGTAHGFVRGTGASGTGTGIRITGGAQTVAPYLDFPNASISGSAEIFPGFAEASYEVWVTVHSARNWSRIIDFGNTSIDEVSAPAGTFNGADYLFVSANVGTANDMRLERGGANLTGGGGQSVAGATTMGARMHVVATYDKGSLAWKLYKNGYLIATVPTLLGPSTIDDLNVWLGRSTWSGDANTDATYEEFRTYDYALSDQQVLGNFQAGPDVLPSDGENHAPSFAANPFAKPYATVGTVYSGNISTAAMDVDSGDTLSYTKISGPAWLTIASNGVLGGTPGSGSAGTNIFTVRATDPDGLFAEATLNIPVINPLPAGWTSADIGNPGIAGNASESSGIYTVSGSGNDIGGTADGFQFASKLLSGDGEIRARVTSQSNTDPAAQAGVMIRDGNAAGAVNALVAVTPGSGFTFKRRTAVNGTTASTPGPALNAYPNNWVRLTRSGTAVTAYVSANGTSWTQVGTATVSMATSISVGLAVSSHTNSVASTATFDNVVITPYPSPWLAGNIGTLGVQCSSEFYGGAHTVKGAGVINSTSDAFRFVYQPISGDGSITARISTLQDTGTGARVGVMIRDTLATNSRMASLAVTGAGAYRWERRSTSGGALTTSNSSSATAPNIWVRLSRSGSVITAYRSANGSAWTTIGSVTITMGTTWQVGLALASGSTSSLNTSVFDNVTVSNLPQPFIPPQQDQDADGLADAWEAIYYPPSQYGPADDPDSDGVSNRDELVAGTSPLDFADATKLGTVSISAATFQINGRSERSYTLERLTAEGTVWEPVDSVNYLRNDVKINLTDPNPPVDRGIYRLKIVFSNEP